jgi:probable HAF family extracellular repeat protein
MHANSHPIRVASFLLASATITPLLKAQYVPIRELDSNHLMTGSHVPKRVVGGIAAGYQASPQEAVLWDANGSNVLAPLSGSIQCWANGLNSSQVVVGWCVDASFQQFATRWTAGLAEDLNTLVTGGAPLFMYDARAIEERGRIVGGAYDTTTFQTRAFLFDNGNVVDLGSLHGGTDSSLAVAVNSHLVAAGQSSSHACRFDQSGVLDLQDPAVMGSGPSWSSDITRDGKIAGGYGTYFATRPFLWDGAKIVDLSPLIPGRSQILGMNDFGDVVGWYDPIGTGHTFFISAFLLHHGVFTDLNTLIDPASGWALGDAFDIDNEGRIVGDGGFGGSSNRAFIMEPVCKGTFTIYGSGCAGTGGLEPRLRGVGCPAPDRDFALEIVDGLPNALGLMFLGTGTTTVQIKPGCDLQILPLLPPFLLPLALDSFGESWNQALLPAGTPTFDLNLQALFFDAGAAYGIAATKPLSLHFE